MKNSRTHWRLADWFRLGGRESRWDGTTSLTGSAQSGSCLRQTSLWQEVRDSLLRTLFFSIGIPIVYKAAVTDTLPLERALNPVREQSFLTG